MRKLDDVRKELKDDRLDEFFVFLDDLRESGRTNMFGATPYLEDEFEITQKHARTVLQAWMDTFSERHK